MTRVLALIAARAGSKGLVHKNVRTVLGVPGLVRAVRLARRFPDWRVVVSTDDQRYAQLAGDAGAAVIMRPAELATDDATLIDVVLHALEHEPCDVVVLLSATTPLICAADVRRAFAAWQTHQVAIASVTRDTPASLRFSVTRNMLTATTSAIPGRRQLEEPVFRLNGAIYIATPAWLREHKRFVVPGQSRAIKMPTRRSIDIDTAADLHLARVFARARTETRRSTKT